MSGTDHHSNRDRVTDGTMPQWENQNQTKQQGTSFFAAKLYDVKKLLQKNHTKKMKRIESWEIEFKDAGTNVYKIWPT